MIYKVNHLLLIFCGVKFSYPWYSNNVCMGIFFFDSGSGGSKFFDVNELPLFHEEFFGIFMFRNSKLDWSCEIPLIFILLLQTYLQSLTIRLEEMRVKRRDSEQWMHHRLLPQELRERVRRYDQYKWLETRGVDEESLVTSLPKDLRRDIKRHLCLALVRRVSSLPLLVFFHAS